MDLPLSGRGFNELLFFSGPFIQKTIRSVKDPALGLSRKRLAGPGFIRPWGILFDKAGALHYNKTF